MSIKKADILQVRKYLNGELDAPAMHRLEREALDDPFLMDALEGYETAGDQQVNLEELSNRLQQRVTPKQRRIIPWAVWPIAASVVLALTIGGLMLKKTPEKQLQAANVIPPPIKQKDTAANIAESKPQPAAADANALVAPRVVEDDASKVVAAKPQSTSVYQQEISSTDKVSANNDAVLDEPAAAPAPVVKPDNAPANEIVAMGYNSQTAKKSADSSFTGKLKEAKMSRSAQTKLQGKVAGLVVVPSTELRNADLGRITGMIISKEDGSPLIGAAVRINGTNRSTVTDVNGKFSLPSSTNKATLDIAYIGYEPRHVNANGGDSLRVALNADKTALSEVVAVGYGSQKNDDEGNAQPQDGWSKFRKYLQTNAYLPDGTTGTVTLSFIVGIDGGLSNFTILKSLNDAANQKAIDLVKTGPVWIGNQDKPQEVKVKVKFRKQK